MQSQRWNWKPSNVGSKNTGIMQSFADATRQSRLETSGMRHRNRSTTIPRSVVFVSRSRQPNQELRPSFIDVNAQAKEKLEVVKRGHKWQRLAKFVVDSGSRRRPETSGVWHRNRSTTIPRSVVFVFRSRQPNQELRPSFIDVNAQAKVKLEAVKRGHKWQRLAKFVVDSGSRSRWITASTMNAMTLVYRLAVPKWVWSNCANPLKRGVGIAQNNWCESHKTLVILWWRNVIKAISTLIVWTCKRIMFISDITHGNVLAKGVANITTGSSSRWGRIYIYAVNYILHTYEVSYTR